jgi:hypothetical protein
VPRKADTVVVQQVGSLTGKFGLLGLEVAPRDRVERAWQIQNCLSTDQVPWVQSVSWPDFGLTRTPKADNCCALSSNVLAGQRLTCWPGEGAAEAGVAAISTV